MCFGVRDAIQLALGQREPLTILGDLVHNPTVLRHLRSQGVKLEHQVARLATPAVMVTAHGVSDRTLDQLRRTGRRVIQGTCPLVHYAHQALRNLVRQGFHPVVIGRRDHVEVRGLTGDFDDADVVLSEDEVDRLTPRTRFGVVAQTTQPSDRVRRLVDRMHWRFPGAEVRFVDTVCQPTKQRQAAAVELAAQSDVVIVVGGAHSNNTHELVATCRRYCPRVHHVQEAADLRSAWLRDARTVGLTAGTSTPDEVIDAVEERLRRLASVFSRSQSNAPG
jgi:4-hydroxy-3-methylbut-2-enyl diphosphate reductase